MAKLSVNGVNTTGQMTRTSKNGVNKMIPAILQLSDGSESDCCTQICQVSLSKLPFLRCYKDRLSDHNMMCVSPLAMSRPVDNPPYNLAKILCQWRTTITRLNLQLSVMTTRGTHEIMSWKSH